MIILLDAGPLGLVSNPKASPVNLRAKEWLVALLDAGAQLAVPEIADYELRRELLRANKTNGIRHLDGLKALALYVPITTDTMLRAAGFWARLRQAGSPMCDPRELDCDAILAAQASLLAEASDEAVVVATTNVAHLERLVAARQWDEIDPAELA